MTGTLPTDFSYTGQRIDAYTQLYEMGARWYDGGIGRWIQADTIVPDPANPQSLNRYSYVYNNPLRHTDPSGHGIKEDLERLIELGVDWTKGKTDEMFHWGAGGVDYLWDSAIDVLPEGKAKNAWQTVSLGVDCFLETDDELQRFGPNKPLTQEMMRDPQIRQFRDNWAAEGYRLPFSAQTFIDEREEGSLISRAAKGLFKLATSKIELGMSLIGLGSFDAVDGVLGSFDKVSVSDAGNGLIRFEVINTTGFASGSRIPGTDWSLFPDRERRQWGPGGTIEQRFYWWEQFSRR